MPKILFIAGTNFELYYLSSVAHLLKRKDPSIQCQLLVRDVFEPNIAPELKNLYTSIQPFKIPTLTFPVSKDPIQTIKNFKKNMEDLSFFRKFIRKVLTNVDIVCISCFREFFANVMAKVAPKPVKLVALRLADEKVEDMKWQKKPFLSFILNIKNFFFGYSPMDYKWSTEQKWYLVTKNYRKNPYSCTIAITDNDLGEKKNLTRILPPFSVLRELFGKGEEKPAILVAGDKTPFYQGWAPQDEENYKKFFDFLRTQFPNHLLYFKPKPGRTDSSHYDLEGFQILPAESSLEEFCLRKNIEKLITIRSTSAKVGAYFGIPSYVLYPMFQIPPDFHQYLDNYFDDMKNSIVKVKNLEDLKKIPNNSISQNSFNNLASLYQEAIIG